MKHKFIVQVTSDNEIRIQGIKPNTGSELKILQEAVGGFIEVVYPDKCKYGFFCKDDAVIDGYSKPNYIGSLMYGSTIFGNIAIVKGFDYEGETIYFDFDEASKLADKASKAIRRRTGKVSKVSVEI